MRSSRCPARAAPVRRAPGITASGHVFALLARHVRAGDLHFEIVDALRLGARVGDAGGGQQLFDIGTVLAANFDHRGVVRQIVLALRQTQSALQDVGQHLARCRQALGDENPEEVLGVVIRRVQRIDVRADLFAEDTRKIGLVGDSIEAREIGLRRRHVSGVDRGGVGVGVVEVRDPRFVRAGRRIGLHDVVHEFGGLTFSLQRGAVERTDA